MPALLDPQQSNERKSLAAKVQSRVIELSPVIVGDSPKIEAI